MQELILTKNEILLSLQIAIVGVVYILVLVEDNMILGKYYNWLEILNLKRPKLAKLMGHCEFCCFGQIALITYLVINWTGYDLTLFVRHIFFIALTILLIFIIKLLCLKIS